MIEAMGTRTISEHKPSSSLREALESAQLVIVFGLKKLCTPLVEIARGQKRVSLEVSGALSARQARRETRAAVERCTQGPVLLFTESDLVVRELSLCMMLNQLPNLRLRTSYTVAETIHRSNVRVFDYNGGKMTPVEVTSHGFRIPEEDDEVQKQSALMQDCFCALDEGDPHE